MEKQVRGADASGWKVAVLECREAGSEVCLLKWLALFYKGCKAKVCFLCTAASVSTTTSLTFRVLLIQAGAPSFYWRESPTFLSQMEHRCELTLEIRLRCFG